MSRIREERAAAGLCTQCGGLLDTDGRMCSVCREKGRLKGAESRQYYRLHGICPYCRKEIIFNTEKMCPECRVKISIRTVARKERLTEEQNNLERKKAYANMNRLRTKRKAVGICVSCGKRNAMENRVYCSLCLAKHREYNREHYRKSREICIPRHERASYGLCYICGKQLDCESRLCKKCRGTMTANLEKGRYINAHRKTDDTLISHITDKQIVKEANV